MSYYDYQIPSKLSPSEAFDIIARVNDTHAHSLIGRISADNVFCAMSEAYDYLTDKGYEVEGFSVLAP